MELFQILAHLAWNEIFSITHEIYVFFNANPSLEVRGVF